MSPFRRKAPDPETAAVREAFRRVTGELDAAQRVLLAAIPTSRDPGGSIVEALTAFLAGLTRAEAGMAAWRRPKAESLWGRCWDALGESRSSAERLLGDPSTPSLAFEPLNAALMGVVTPLEEFADVAAELRRLR
ncbi:MAG: hypothetical protein ACRDJ1_07200 [Actinomycetota bacterium]